MKTQVFENYGAFLAREDKTINGVLPGCAVLDHDDGNVGCWMCFNCTRCRGCTHCAGCERCTRCMQCTRCIDCADCTGCMGCAGCERCTGCTECMYCADCTGCIGCTDCTECKYCTYCKRCMGCTRCTECFKIPAGAVYACMTGLYKYTCTPRIHKDESQWVQMGCYLLTREEWERDEWNNPNEFPNDGSHESQRRHFALMTAFAWLDANAKK